LGPGFSLGGQWPASGRQWPPLLEKTSTRLPDDLPASTPTTNAGARQLARHPVERAAADLGMSLKLWVEVKTFDSAMRMVERVSASASCRTA
jgi:hypothetical protein